MNIKELKQELHQNGINVNDSAIVSTLKEAGLTVEDVTDKSLDVVIEIFEEKYPRSTETTTLTTSKNSGVPENSIASPSRSAATALATATAPQTKGTIDLADLPPVNSLTLSRSKELIADLEIRSETLTGEAQDAVIGYLMDLYDHIDRFTHLVKQSSYAMRQVKDSAYQELLQEHCGVDELLRDSAIHLRKVQGDRFRQSNEEFAQFVGRISTRGAS